MSTHDDVIKWKYFSLYWPFVRGIHRSPVNFPHKGQCRGALMFSLICAWTNGWVNTRVAGDLRRNRAHYNVTVMWDISCLCWIQTHIYMLFLLFSCDMKYENRVIEQRYIYSRIHLLLHMFVRCVPGYIWHLIQPCAVYAWQNWLDIYKNSPRPCPVSFIGSGDGLSPARCLSLNRWRLCRGVIILKQAHKQ